MREQRADAVGHVSPARDYICLTGQNMENNKKANVLPQFQQQKKSLNFIVDSMKKDPGNLLTESLYQTWILWENFQEIYS